MALFSPDQTIGLLLTQCFDPHWPFFRVHFHQNIYVLKVETLHKMNTHTKNIFKAEAHLLVCWQIAMIGLHMYIVYTTLGTTKPAGIYSRRDSIAVNLLSKCWLARCSWPGSCTVNVYIYLVEHYISRFPSSKLWRNWILNRQICS